MADHRPVETDAVTAQAVDLVQRLASGHASAGDMAEASAFRAQSPRHEAAFAAASRIWLQVGAAAENLRRRGAVSAALPDRRSVIARRALIGGGLAAASVAVAAAIQPPMDLWPSLSELAADYRTVTGEQRLLALHDDLSMRLNARTSVKIRGSEANADQLEILSGQASFATPGDGRRRLVVFANGGTMTAERGRFDVRCADDEARVTCVEGEAFVIRGADRTTLRAAEQVTYGPAKWDQIASVDIGLVTAWEQGVLIFRMTPLAEVVDEINRYRPGRVVIFDRALARKTVSGRFRTDHIDEILLRLNQALGIKSRALPGGLVVLT